MTVQAPITRALLEPEALEKWLAESGARDPAGLAAQLRVAIEAQENHERQRALGQAREAYREGFLAGRTIPRIVPFSMALWRASRAFNRLRAQPGPGDAVPSRYAQYEEF